MDKFKGAVMVGALRLFALLPWRAVQWAGTAIGWLMWKLPNRSREVARINLSKCFPELSEPELEKLVGRSLMDIGKTLTESACAWIWPAQKSIDLVREVEGLDVLKDALASGKGVVGITSHLGNWEVLNHFYCSQCKPIIFYRPPKLKAVDDLLRKQRVQLGNRVAASTKEGILSVIKEVRKGGSVGIPADPEPAESAGIFRALLRHPGADQQVRTEHAGRRQGSRCIPARHAPAGRLGLQSGTRSGSGSHVQHRHRNLGSGDEQSGREIRAGLP